MNTSPSTTAVDRQCRSAEPVAGWRKRWMDLGPIDAIAPGQGRPFVLASRIIAVFRQRDGRVFAIDNQCPHRGGPLADGIVGDGTVICPLHNWKIDLASGRCRGEAASVRTYDVRVVAGRLWLGLEMAG